MKAIPMKARVMPKITTANKLWSFISDNRLHISIAGAAICYLGCIISADMVMYAGAIIGLMAVRPSAEKGGER